MVLVVVVELSYTWQTCPAAPADKPHASPMLVRSNAGDNI